LKEIKHINNGKVYHAPDSKTVLFGRQCSPNLSIDAGQFLAIVQIASVENMTN
jgi:hypothetical protein